MAAQTIPTILTIAGSDSGGGAGIQADIKAISATGGYACSVITALTAQNTLGVTGIYPISAEFVELQLDAVFSDLTVSAVKIGMLSDEQVIHSVAKKLHQYQPSFVVLDPVMVATSGDLLLERTAVSALKEALLPLADIITPNIPEAAALTGSPIPRDETELQALIHQLKQLDTHAVLLKGGHFHHDNSSTDFLITVEEVASYSSQRIQTKNTHGTGCTLSSALASFIAQGHSLIKSVRLAKEYIDQAIKQSNQLKVGKGNGPVHHFFSGHGEVGRRQ